MPRVSVIMTAYNAARHLREAVDSILGQTVTDLELIVVDDASADDTADILASISDPRLRVVRNADNMGAYPSANRGLELASSPIIARMDSDDISAPQRLERQFAFLDANTDHMLVATSYRSIDDDGKQRYLKVKPYDDFKARWVMRFRMPVEHPSMCFRASFPDGTPVRYDTSRPVAQDYELVTRLSERGKIAVLPDLLFSYRMHAANLSTSRRAEQADNCLRIARMVQARMLPADIAGALEPFMRSYQLGEPLTPTNARAALAAFKSMLRRDVAEQPDAKRWLRRQAAGVLAEGIIRRGGGLKHPQTVIDFALSRFPLPLVLRQLEDRNVLPRPFMSNV